MSLPFGRLLDDYYCAYADRAPESYPGVARLWPLFSPVFGVRRKRGENSPKTSRSFARPSRNPHKQGLRSFWHYKIAPVPGFCSCRAGETAVSTLSDSMAPTHLNINAPLSLTCCYSPYNGNLKDPTVDYQRLTTEKWRKSPLIDT